MLQLPTKPNGVRERRLCGYNPLMTTSPAASVVIITRNQQASLRRSLPVLQAQAGLTGLVETIVVDSGSTDGAQQVVRASGATLIGIDPARFNYARAYNAGIFHATAPVVVRLSGDALPAHDGWLCALLAPFADPLVAATWGRQEMPDGVRNLLERWAERTLRPARLSSPVAYRRDITVLGSTMALRRDLWEAWPFDERLPQAEDYAWMHHWYRQGRVGVYVPQAVIAHGHDEPFPRAARRALAQSVLQGTVWLNFWERRRTA